jgi:MtN3 and saliva related transmembrane protein
MLKPIFLIEIFMCIIGPLITSSGIPQILRLYHRKTSDDISLITWTAYVFGSICWLFYGVVRLSWPLIISSTIGVVLNVSILVFCLAYRQFKPEIPETNREDGIDFATVMVPAPEEEE